MFLNLQLINFVNKNNLIHKNFVCKNQKGRNLTPHVKWTPIPNVRSYAIVFEDPDAVNGNFIHWYVPYISNKINELESFNNKYINISNIHQINLSKLNLFQGKNSLDKIGYHGPCAPKLTGIHNYIFTLYALDNIIPIDYLKINNSIQFENILQKNNIQIIAKDQKIFQYTFSTNL
jgi:Raf kinase inhibitor-like YbhB/YbcL family protein